jgi:hypothetical protein
VTLRRTLVAAWAALLCAACYPSYDWRDVRPDCGRYWCGFVASFPGKVTSAARDVPVDGGTLPIAFHVVSSGKLTFAVGVVDLSGGRDADRARAVLEAKLQGDVGATSGTRGTATLRSAARDALTAVSFQAAGERGVATARFVRRGDRLVEMLVIGDAKAFASDTGREAIDTFFTSMRLD